MNAKIAVLAFCGVLHTSCATTTSIPEPLEPMVIGARGDGVREFLVEFPALSMPGYFDIIQKETNEALWEIRCRTVVADTFLSIKYGTVPEGWEQRIPDDGSPPKEISDGAEIVVLIAYVTTIQKPSGPRLVKYSFRKTPIGFVRTAQP